MTVEELIKKLQEVDQGLDVWLEGCDCDNPATSVRVKDNTLFIEIRDGGKE